MAGAPIKRAAAAGAAAAESEDHGRGTARSLRYRVIQAAFAALAAAGAWLVTSGAWPPLDEFVVALGAAFIIPGAAGTIMMAMNLEVAERLHIRFNHQNRILADISETQRGILRTQERILGTQERILDTQEKILDTQEKILRTQEKILDTQERILDTQEKILGAQREMAGTLREMSATLKGMARTLERIDAKIPDPGAAEGGVHAGPAAGPRRAGAAQL